MCEVVEKNTYFYKKKIVFVKLILSSVFIKLMNLKIYIK